jgi:hypothetical protein
MFREYSASQQGRWVSPDPAGLAAVIPTNPQSWNRYAYVNNNPLRLTDPLGLFPCGECGIGGDDGGVDEGEGYFAPGGCYEVVVDGVDAGNSCRVPRPERSLRRVGESPFMPRNLTPVPTGRAARSFIAEQNVSVRKVLEGAPLLR